ncbi:MAG: TonB-dependent receptor [Alteromonadaceae bacterium]|nr:TonB-dependent receptor [Alteromonadaceae bacterium]
MIFRTQFTSNAFVLGLALCSFVSFAEDYATEVIEVLAPKVEESERPNYVLDVYLQDFVEPGLDRTIADRFSSLAGVGLTGQGGQFQSYSVRGFSRGRIRTEIDGIPILTDRRAGNSVSFVAPELFAQAMVIKGPSSALFGSQALGGVVSLSTDMYTSTSINAAVQANNDALNLTIKSGDSRWSKGLAYQRADNEHAANGDELNTHFERVSGSLKFHKQEAGLTTTFSWLPSYGQDIGKSNNRYLSREVSSYPEEIHSLAQVQVKSDSGWWGKVFHHYQNWDSVTLRFGQSDAENQYQSNTIGGQFSQAHDVFGTNGLIGVDWLSRQGINVVSQYLLLDAQNVPFNDLINNHFNGSEDNVAIYQNSQWQWQGVDIELGGRYDWLRQRANTQKDITESRFNASLALSIPLHSTLQLDADFANGFRYPTLSERFFNGRTPRGIVVGNSTLKPETSIGGQLGLDWQPSDNLAIRGSMYFYELHNYIERYLVEQDRFSYRNLSNANLYGVEASVQWRYSPDSHHTLNYQSQHGKNANNQTLTDLLPDRVNWQWKLLFDKLSLVNSVSHVLGNQNVGSSEVARANYTLWNAAFGYHLGNDQTLTLSLINITNRIYYASFDEDAPLQPERSVRVGFTLQF